MRTYRLAIPVAAVLAAASCSGIAAAQTTTPTAPPADPPSVAQLCAATGITEVDSLLDGVARTDLAGALAPLLTLTVPARDTAELDASVQLADVRQRLNCEVTPTTTTAPPTTSTTTAPTSTTTTTTRTTSIGGGFTQLDQVPTGAAETGGGPA